MNNPNYWDVSPITSPDMKSLELYDYTSPDAPQRYWRRKDLSVADYLMQHREDLTRDFLKGHSTLDEAVRAKKLIGAFDDRHELDDIEISQLVLNNARSDLKAWKVLPFRYQHNRIGREEVYNQRLREHPTAFKLIHKFRGDVAIATYSVIEPNSVIARHTGPENRDGEYIRIHIPLIIPPGDVFFECLGEVITWDDIWGFNNQLIHSAHNYTDEYRLVFLIDLRRTAIGLEPGEPFDEKWQIHAKPFIREKQS